MKRYVIERDIPGVGRLDEAARRNVAAQSNRALGKLSGTVQWLHSYVVDDNTFCIYLADTEDSVREHARLSGFPANKVTEVRTVIDPTTEMI